MRYIKNKGLTICDTPCGAQVEIADLENLEVISSDRVEIICDVSSNELRHI